MAADTVSNETCARCGQPPAEGRIFCHVYQGPECVTLCSTRCALAFIETPPAPVNGGANVRSLDEIMDDLRWRNYGR